MQSRKPEYLQKFVIESLRGEFAHWLMLALTPLVILWNPPWAVAVMTFAGLLLNLPCILTSRYNRIVLQRILEKMHSPTISGR